MVHGMKFKLPHPKNVPAALSGVAGGVLGGMVTSKRKMDAPVSLRKETEVLLIKAEDKIAGIRKLLKLRGMANYRGKMVALKANYNSDDPFPASTDIGTLEVIVDELKKAGIGGLTLAERSGMGNTRKVLEKTGVLRLSEKLGFKAVVLEEEDKDSWQKIGAKGTHWINGFHISKIFLAADKVVQTCCLKTHRFGGHFTMSLKNSVGLVAKRLPGLAYDYMMELHTSPHQRLMIAEINSFYNVDLVIMDATKAFVNGGPERGDLVEPNLLLVSNDRVAIDAVGVAILRSYGSTKDVMKGRIFELEQIRRAAELGVGVNSASQVKLTPADDKSSEVAETIAGILRDQG